MFAALPIPLPLLLMYYYLYAEDMFGADDADWAIYRKIVRVSRPPLSVILFLTLFPLPF